MSSGERRDSPLPPCVLCSDPPLCRLVTARLEVRLRLSWLAFVVLFMGACGSQGSGFVHGERLELPSCDELDVARTYQPFEMDLTFMSLLRDKNVMTITFSPTPRIWPVPDSLIITVDDMEGLLDELENEGSAERSVDGPGVGVALSLASSCPKNTAALRATHGTIRFDELGFRKGDPVRATLDFDLIDMRDGTQIGDLFDAEVNFLVEVGSPAQPFSDPAATPH